MRHAVLLPALAGCIEWAEPPDGREAAQFGCAAGRSCNPIVVNGFPSTLSGDTRTTGTDDLVDHYGCAPTINEGGAEVWYAVDVPSAGRLTASIPEVSGDGIDVDVHILSSTDPNACLARGNSSAAAQVEAGRVYIVVDTWVSSTGKAQSGPYAVTIDLVGVPESDCAVVPTDVAMRWTSCSSSVPDCFKSGSTVLLSTPTVGPIVKEAHLVTVEDGISGWPSSARDRITQHYAISASISGYDMARTEPWAPAGEGGSAWGQSATSTKLPADAEAFYVNMNWKTRPAAGTPMIIRNPATGLAVVAAAGYETGPGANTAIGGVSEEVHDWLGTGHLDDLEIGFAKDTTLPYGPVVCTTGAPPPPPPPPPETDPDETPTEACYLGATRAGTTCLPIAPLPSGTPGYVYTHDAPARFLDVDALDPDLKVAPNFVLSELAPDGNYAVISTTAVAHLQALRDQLGALIVVNGYLPPDGGDSRHPYGDAFDLDPVTASVTSLANACEDEGAGYVVIDGSHVHCDWSADPFDPAFFD